MEGHTRRLDRGVVEDLRCLRRDPAKKGAYYAKRRFRAWSTAHARWIPEK